MTGDQQLRTRDYFDVAVAGQGLHITEPVFRLFGVFEQSAEPAAADRSGFGGFRLGDVRVIGAQQRIALVAVFGQGGKFQSEFRGFGQGTCRLSP